MWIMKTVTAAANMQIRVNHRPLFSGSLKLNLKTLGKARLSGGKVQSIYFSNPTLAGLSVARIR